MPVLELVMEGDGAFKEQIDRASEVVHLGEEAVVRVALLEGGMTSGLPSVAFGFELPDGRYVIAETSARLLVAAGRAVAAKFPEVAE